MSQVFYDLKTEQLYYMGGYIRPGSGTPTKQINLPIPDRIVTEVKEVKIPTMPVLAGFEKTIKEELETLATALSGVSQPIIYTETPQGVKEINWKIILPIIAVVGFLIFGR